MRKNVKQDILRTARALFNERGYNGVSTQNIADAMGISKGNLNYHFHRKEDIIEAVVEEMHSHYVKPTPPATLAELNGLLARTQTVVAENAFYFWHYTQLAQLSPRIREIQSEVIDNQHALFVDAFERFRRAGIFGAEEYPGQYRQIIRAVVLTGIYWVPHSRFWEGDPASEDFPSCAWAILYPLLSECGKREYRENIKNAGE